MGNTVNSATTAVSDTVSTTTTTIKHSFNNVSTTITGSLNPFGQTTTADQVALKADLSGQVVIVTGGTSGLGLETVRILYNHGAHVVIASRDINKMQQVAKQLEKARSDLLQLQQRQQQQRSQSQQQQQSQDQQQVRNINSNGQISCIECDLASLESITDFVKQFSQQFSSLNMLVLNSAKMIPPLSYTHDGFEMQYGVNHLGHFALTLQLLTLMKETTENELNKGRIIVLSSFAHEYANTIHFEDLYWKKRPYATGWAAFAEANLANLLFAQHLSKLLVKNGVDINVYAVNPGVVKSSLTMDEHALSRLGIWLTHPFIKSMEQGAATAVYCATSNTLEDLPFAYFSDCNPTETSKVVKDTSLSNKLWVLSEQLTRQKYPFSVSTNI